MPREDFVQPRGGTAALWASRNPVLAFRELGVETDTKKMKIGDNVTHWNDLPYITGPVDGDNVDLQVKRDTETNLAASTTPIPNGTLVYNQTTGRMKIGDGETLWPNLPDPGKQFINVITVAKDGVKGSADFICSEYDSDDECIQAAIDFTTTGIIHINEGDYTTQSLIEKENKNINLIGIGNVNIYLQSQVVTGADGFVFRGSLVTSLTLSTDAGINSNAITVSDASAVSPGDLLKIWKNVQWCPDDYPEHLIGEMYEISNVSGTTITLSEPLIHGYQVSETVSINVYNPISVNIQNINFIDSGSTASRTGLALSFCKNSVIKNCNFSNSGTAAISIYSCYNVKCESNDIRDCIKEGSGYGIAIWNSSTRINISDNHIQNCRHTITGNSSEAHGLNRKINIEKNTLIGATITGSSVIDSHNVTWDYTVTRNKIYVKADSYYGFLDGTYISEFSYNEVWGGQGAVGKRGELVGCKREVHHNKLHDTSTCIIPGNSGGDICNVYNNIQDGGLYGVYVSPSGTASYKNLKIVNNVFENIINQGMLLFCNLDAMDIEIIGNVLKNINNGGIYLEKKSTSNGLISIKNNVMHDINLLDNFAYGLGVKLVSTQGAIVDGNTITDSANLMDYGVYEYTGSDYSVISNNKISGAGSKAIRITGTHTMIHNNPGYTTENTGTATIPATQTSVTISHGLVSTPTRYSVTPSANIGNCWIGTITSTQMTINCSTAPEADTVVSWSAQVV